MGILLLGLVAYLFFVEFPQQQKKQEAESKAKKVFEIDETTAQAIRIRYPDLEIKLEKTPENRWNITHPVAAEADDREVKSLLSTVVDMRLTRVVEERNQDPAQYGFDHPPVEITLTLPGHEEQVVVGEDGPVANTLFVKRGSDQRVMLVEQWVKGALTRSLLDLRDKTVLPMDRDKVTELVLHLPQKDFSFDKENDQWMLKEPKTLRADNDTIRNLLAALQNLRATDFVDSEEEKEKTRKEFKKPEWIVTLKEEAKNPTVSFYRAKDKRTLFAVTAPDRPLYRISDAILTDFKSDLFYYQDKRLLLFDPDQVQVIEVKTESESYKLKKTENAWSLEGESGELDSDAVTGFLNHLKLLRAQEQPVSPVQPKASGLDPVTTEVRLFNGQGQSLGELKVGKEERGKLYATGVPELGITLITKDILDNIPKKSELMKPSPPTSG
jgi:hypothetical protein